MDFSITLETNELESLAFTSSLKTSEEVSVTIDLLKRSIEVSSEQQHLREN